ATYHTTSAPLTSPLSLTDPLPTSRAVRSSAQRSRPRSPSSPSEGDRHVDRFLTADDLAKTLRQDVHDGLTGTPKTLPPKWFYDERGSALFEEVTRLEED